MVREVNVDDINRIYELGKLVNPNFEKLFKIDSVIKDRRQKIFVYEIDNNVVGFIHITILYEIMDIINIVVDEKYRKQKIATNLIDYAISENNTLEKVLLEVNENNEAALRLYDSLGFKKINERKNYYEDSNALVMERVI